jgi:hypothetical protein
VVVLDGMQAKKPDDPKERERAREKLLKQRMRQKTTAQERVCCPEA